MPRQTTRRLWTWTIALAALLVTVGVALALVGAWLASREAGAAQQHIVETEVAALRARAKERAGYIQCGMEQLVEDGDWYSAKQSDWLVEQWQRTRTAGPRPLYAAIVDNDRVIVLHTDPTLEDGQLRDQYYDRKVPEAGDDVVEVSGEELTGGRRAINVRVPIYAGGDRIGTYHEGTDADIISKRVEARRDEIYGGYISGIALAELALAAIGVAAFLLGRFSLDTRIIEIHSRDKRAGELAQLAGGLAHEIRNPLHAIRLNLHALRRAHMKKTELPHEDVAAMLGESEQEIARVERLLADLVGFARPEAAQEKELDLNAEVRAAIDFLKEQMKTKEVQVHAEYASRPAVIRMDPARLRQVLLNLLLNARQAVPPGGRIDAVVRVRGRQMEILVTDNGPGIPITDRRRVFEPYYSTKDEGSGLGLALARRFIEEAGGSIRCESDSAEGTTFRIALPIVSSST